MPHTTAICNVFRKALSHQLALATTFKAKKLAADKPDWIAENLESANGIRALLGLE